MAYINGKEILFSSNVTCCDLPDQEKTVTPSLLAQEITPDSGYDLKKVTVEAATEVYEKGIADERTRFWEIYQKSGSRDSYANAFFGVGWTDETYNPIYEIKPKNASNGLSSTFCYSKMTDTIVDINASYVPTLNSTFRNSSIKIIRKLIVKSTTAYTNTFVGCADLENITFSFANLDIFNKYIGNDISFADCVVLSKESITHIQNLTYNSEITVTFSLAAVNKAFETSSGANDGSTSEEWEEVRTSSVLNTIVLV